jgi:hypothetical protein
MKRENRSLSQDRLVREILRALDGKWAGTYPQLLARRISMLDDVAGSEKFRAIYEDEMNWLGSELVRLVQAGDTKTLRQIADARDHLRKDGEMFNRKRYYRLRAYLKIYERTGRPPTIKEILKQLDIPGDDERRALNDERGIRKLLDDLDLPYTNVPTGHPKGVTNSRNSERLRRLRSLLLR